MDFIFSLHAQEQMIRRGIDSHTVLVVLSAPDQMIVDNDAPDIVIYQSVVKEDGLLFLLRVFVNRNKKPNVIVTLYKTTKISKYYEN